MGQEEYDAYEFPRNVPAGQNSSLNLSLDPSTYGGHEMDMGGPMVGGMPSGGAGGRISGGGDFSGDIFQPGQLVGGTTLSPRASLSALPSSPSRSSSLETPPLPPSPSYQLNPPPHLKTSTEIWAPLLYHTV